jgi:phosphoribosylaminoimidazolecarboxamide formyltransferase/IMP cyclohydrolase
LPILKHNNACGLAQENNYEAYVAALAQTHLLLVDVLIANTTIDATAIEINKLFCEVVIAPYDKEAITILEKRKQNY